MIRLLALFLGLAVLVVVPFLIWGEDLERRWGLLDAADWMRDYGVWAWAVGVLLLLSDLILPIPATAIMAGLGVLYGPWLGGMLAAGGSFLSGSAGYMACRAFGHDAAVWILGAEDLERGEALFSRFGGWLVALSRWLPVFPEVMACMAGLARMPRASFFAALACGSLPFGFVFAAIGHAGVDRPMLAIGFSALVPPILWFAAHRYLLRKGLLEVGHCQRTNT
ncbi:MAG: TVP38/TMEM64 family protein [Geminicoccaceae bacterium]